MRTSRPDVAAAGDGRTPRAGPVGRPSSRAGADRLPVGRRRSARTCPSRPAEAEPVRRRSSVSGGCAGDDRRSGRRAGPAPMLASDRSTATYRTTPRTTQDDERRQAAPRDEAPADAPDQPRVGGVGRRAPASVAGRSARDAVRHRPSRYPTPRTVSISRPAAPSFVAQVVDVGVDRVRRHRHAERPGLVEQLVARQRLAGVAQEALEQRELARAQVDRACRRAVTRRDVSSSVIGPTDELRLAVRDAVAAAPARAPAAGRPAPRRRTA